jgi:hypothetical protein
MRGNVLPFPENEKLHFWGAVSGYPLQSTPKAWDFRCYPGRLPSGQSPDGSRYRDRYKTQVILPSSRSGTMAKLCFIFSG